MITEVSFLEDAFAEYEAAFEWYFLRSEFVAANFVEELNRAVYNVGPLPAMELANSF
jgi:hypothetical protein